MFAGLLAGAAPASATFHLMKVVYVVTGYADAAGAHGGPYDNGAQAEGVVLQMYQSGQHLLTGHTVSFYDEDGNEATATFTGPVDNDDNQSTVMIGTTRFKEILGKTPDLEISNADRLDPAGGAVCFEDIDCVGWGSFEFTTPSVIGDAFPGGVPDAQPLYRHITRGCATRLDASDDTNDAATDFSLTPDLGYNPFRTNSEPPTEPACPDTRITKGPKPKTTDRTPTFRFSSPGHPAATFECRLDKGSFVPCNSPFTSKRLKLGRHRFSVRATDLTTDPSPARRTFKIVRR